MLVKEIMHKGIDFIAPDCSVKEAAGIMKRKNIGALPVCHMGALWGILTDRDIVVRAVAEGSDPGSIRVSKIMTAAPVRCRTDEDITVVARRMEDKKLRRILVVNQEGKLAGMLSIDDFTHRGPAQDLVAEVLESAAARHS